MSNETNNVVPVDFGKNDLEKIARVTSGVSDLQLDTTESPLSDDEESQSVSVEQQDNLSVPRPLKIAGIVTIGAIAVSMFAPRGSEEVPATPPTYEQLVQESAQKPLQESDKVLVDEIPVETTISETVANSPEIAKLTQKLTQENDENLKKVPSIVTSANWVPESAKYITVVGRDIDKDGDEDAIVVASK